jgi:hypothetical protein
VDTAARPIPELVDRALATYLEWRDTTRAVADTDGWWRVAPAFEEVMGFAGYDGWWRVAPAFEEVMGFAGYPGHSTRSRPRPGCTPGRSASTNDGYRIRTRVPDSEPRAAPG